MNSLGFPLIAINSLVGSFIVMNSLVGQVIAINAFVGPFILPLTHWLVLIYRHELIGWSIYCH